MVYSIVLALIFLVAVPTCAEDRTVTMRGVVDWGTSTSGIGGLGPYYGFATNSEVADEVFSVCNFLDNCEMTGTVNDKNVLTSLIKIRRIDTEKEPSVEIITEAAHWALSTTEALKNDQLCFESVHILNFHSTSNGAEAIFECDFKIVGSECGPYIPREIGTGTVRIVKRGDTWHYYR